MKKYVIVYALMILLFGCSSLQKSNDGGGTVAVNDRVPTQAHPVDKAKCYTFGQLRKELKLQVEQLEQQIPKPSKGKSKGRKIEIDASDASDVSDAEETIKVNNSLMQAYDWLCGEEIVVATIATETPLTCIYGSVFKPRVAQLNVIDKKIVLQGMTYVMVERQPETKVEGKLYATKDDSSQIMITKDGFHIKDHGYQGNKYKFVPAVCYSNKN
jgi:hypothetical protein